MTAGECNCGAVSFVISTPVKDIYVCHCSICRRNTGGMGVAVNVVPNTDFEWLAGQDHIKTWCKPGHDWQASFCLICGSSLPGKNSETTMYIPVSLLTSGTESLTVAHHIFVDSKAAWEVIGDAGKQHMGAFEG